MKYYIVPSGHHTPSDAFRDEESAKKSCEFESSMRRKALSVEKAITTDEFMGAAMELKRRVGMALVDDEITEAANLLLERLGV